ncbi:branched-chain amino acid ABC transporter permease [Oceanidesulfovibrio indonesiensis]|uniref:Branched-chain amino acid ABC transporter permease n=1 Tax=Oceanidesulfovibrio indonesiensis TaxID=54767 RepID=A0A7M3MBI5_9BACT|nr:branched-chain amino acid ABC transporter permease [Oceanidesulfovibrio indonesiensis]TVM15553.1 branched-chain amino acid ABC transporter permease [Oceanidesulfovibrio indonesiensis]
MSSLNDTPAPDPRSRELVPAAAFFLPLVALGLLLPAYSLLAVNQHLLLAVNVLALNFCLGLGGQASLAQGAFCGMGAYLSALVVSACPESAAITLPVIIVVVFVFGALVSYPMEQLGEGFLAMATLGVSLIFTNVVLSLPELTGGGEGMVLHVPITLPGIGALQGDRLHYFLFLGLLALGAYLYVTMRSTRLGRALMACREDPLAAAACGVSRPRVRALAFGLGAGLSALAGALYAHYAGFISPNQFDLHLSLKALLFLVIGGPGRLYTPLIAVLLLETLLSEAQLLGEARTMAHGLLLAAALLFDPERRLPGLASLVPRSLRR